jgi:hypothetical protein
MSATMTGSNSIRNSVEQQEVRNMVHVPNVALAEATAQQRPSPWTKHMFMVCAEELVQDVDVLNLIY